MEASKRVEIAARAMARYRLGMDSFTSSLNPDVIAKVRQSAEDRLWPCLVNEAKAMVEAIDAFERETNGRAIEKGRVDDLPGEDPGQIFAPAPGVKPGGLSPPQEPSVDAKPGESPGGPDSRPRFSWLGAPRLAKAAPQKEAGVDPATEALRSAFAALAATGISNRGRTRD